MSHSKAEPSPIRKAVAATDVVRHFAQWQTQLAGGPVHIHHHGRPRSVLLSAESFEALTRAALAEDDGGAAARAELAVLLDIVPNAFIQFDRDLRIVRLNPAGRAHLRVSDHDVIGLTLDTLVPHESVQLLCGTLERVIATGIRESFETRSILYEDRRLSLAILPLREGCAILVTDLTAEVELKTLRARIAALEELAALDPDSAGGRLCTRGQILDAQPGLQALTGVDPRAVVGARMVSLFDLAVRGECGERIDAVARTGEPVAFESLLLTREGVRPVRIALAPIRIDALIRGIAFTVSAGKAPRPN